MSILRDIRRAKLSRDAIKAEAERLAPLGYGHYRQHYGAADDSYRHSLEKVLEMLVDLGWQPPEPR